MIQLRKFTDPFYGSETQLQFEPETIANVEDRYRWLWPFRRYPATYIQLKNGRHYWAAGHHAAEIRAAQQEAAQSAEGTDD